MVYHSRPQPEMSEGIREYQGLKQALGREVLQPGKGHLLLNRPQA
jgi:hypothetical protein